MAVIDRAIQPIFIDDPAFEEFKHLIVRKGQPDG
jgi:hypothetical protein